MSDRPIGIFDSGVGGLTVCSAIQRTLPNENIVYIGDSARVPYGNKSPQTIIRYSQEITEFLFEQNIKMLIIACNTATTWALQPLRNIYASHNVPIFGVIYAGSQRAVAWRAYWCYTQGTIEANNIKEVSIIDPHTKSTHNLVLIYL